MIVCERRGRAWRCAYALPAWAGVVLLVTAVLVLPRASSDETARRLWNATVTYKEEGLVRLDRTGRNWRKWRKQASAQYLLTTFERADHGFTWDNAQVSYTDKYDEHEESLEGAMDTYWDVSGSFTVKSIDDQAHQAKEAARRGQSQVRGAVFGGLVLHRQGDRVMALETPGIVINAFHPGAKTIRTKESTRREDVRVSIGHSPDQALTREERERRQKEMEQALKPQVDDMVKKQTKVVDEQKALAEKYKALAEKFKHGAPKSTAPAKPGEPELTPEMAAYLEQILRSMPPEVEEAGERVAEAEQSQEALIMATLEQGGGKVLTGRPISGTRRWGATETERQWAGLDGSVTITRMLSWNYVPLPEDVEAVLIAQDDYEQWMPQGGANEDTIANKLDVRVVLQLKGQKGVAPPATARFKFELLNTSKERGVSLNSPPRDKAKGSYDLRINAQDNPDLKIIDKDGQSAESKAFGREARLTIASYDWGAYGELRVSAILDDKKKPPLEARWEKKPQLKRFTIPLDENGNRIADQWEKDNDIFERNLKADQDIAEEPKDQRAAGDGISVYEKYRGFEFGHGHERLDPHRKHVFIYDPDGVVRKTFLDYPQGAFHAVSGLLVRFIGPDQWTGAGSHTAKRRIVNFNHGWGHAVDQHALHVTKKKHHLATPPGWRKTIKKLDKKLQQDLEWLYQPSESMAGYAFPDVGFDIKRHSPKHFYQLIVFPRALAEEMFGGAILALCKNRVWVPAGHAHPSVACASGDQAFKDLIDYDIANPKENPKRYRQGLAALVSHELAHGVGVNHHAPDPFGGDRRCVMRYMEPVTECGLKPGDPARLNDPYLLRCYAPWPDRLSRDAANPCLFGASCWKSVIVTDKDR